MFPTIVPHRLPFLILDEVAATGQLEPACAASIYLGRAIESEDVVLRPDIMVVVRKEGAVLAAVYDVVLDQQVVAAFIQVNPPPTVVSSPHIMHPIVTDQRVGRAAGVNGPQIAEHPLADVMDVIVFDEIARGMAWSKILDRANGYARVEQIVNVVVNNPIVGIVPHEHPHRFRSHPAAVGDFVVGDRYPPAVRAFWHRGFALDSPLGQTAQVVCLPREKVTDANSPRADIRNLVARNLDVRAALINLDAVVAEVFNAAVRDGAAFGVIKQNRAGHFDSGLK